MNQIQITALLAALALAGCHAQEQSPSHTVSVVARAEATGVDPTLEELALAIASDFPSWGPIDGMVRVAPALCRVPPSVYQASAAERGPHARKLYRLHARDPHAYLGVESGAPQTGQVIVKQAFTPVSYEMPGPGKLPSDIVKIGSDLVRPGSVAGLFIMMRTDEGVGEEAWRYATVDTAGIVTAAGRIASCIGCHTDAPYAGLFGLEGR